MFPSLLKKSFCSVYGLAYLYLSSSVMIFLLGFFKWWIGIPVTLLVLYAVGKSIYEAPEQQIPFRILNFKWLAVIGTILLWVILSGIGGYMPQTFDQIWRNVMFTDLAKFDWPVVQGDSIFVYYIGFWLPSALVGKLFGIEAGFAFQVIWATIGIVLTFVMLCDYLGKFRYWFLLVFIFWGGTLLCCCCTLLNEFKNGNYFFSLNTLHHLTFGNYTLSLYAIQVPRNLIITRWVFNQGIPFWVGFMLILKLLKSKQYFPLFLICSILLLSSPFSTIPVGLLCIFSVAIDKNNWTKEKLISFKKNTIFNIENITVIFITLLVALFYKSNISASHYGIFNCSKILIASSYFFVGCFGVYFIFVPKLVIKKPYLLFLIFITFILSFVQIGFWFDFNYRIWYPLSFVTMVFVIECLANINIGKKTKIIFALLLLSSSLFSLDEFRHIIFEKLENHNSRIGAPFATILESKASNFTGSTNSFYYQHLAPHRGVLPAIKNDITEEQMNKQVWEEIKRSRSHYYSH